MSTIKGRNMAVWIDGKVVTGSRSCTLRISCDLQEVSSPDSGRYKNYIVKKMSWSVQTNHLVQTSNSGDFTSMIGKKAKLVFAKSSKVQETWHEDTSEPMKFTGWVLVSEIDIDADMGDYCKGTFKFTGTGALSNA